MLIEVESVQSGKQRWEKRAWPDLVLLPQQSHKAVVLLAAARRVRRAAGASQRVVVLTDGGAGDLDQGEFIIHKVSSVTLPSLVSRV